MSKRSNEEITQENTQQKKTKLQQQLEEDIKGQTDPFVIETLENPEFFRKTRDFIRKFDILDPEVEDFVQKRGKYHNKPIEQSIDLLRAFIDELNNKYTQPYKEYLIGLPLYPKELEDYSYESISQYWNEKYVQSDPTDESTLQNLEFYISTVV